MTFRTYSEYLYYVDYVLYLLDRHIDQKERERERAA